MPENSLTRILPALLLWAAIVPAAAGDSVDFLDLLAADDAALQAQWAQRYEHAEGVPQDYDRALRLYCRAAWHGHADSQYRLGWLYANGRGVDKDEALAAAWFRLALASGDRYAAGMLRFVDDAAARRPALCIRPDGSLFAKPQQADSKGLSLKLSSTVGSPSQATRRSSPAAKAAKKRRPQARRAPAPRRNAQPSPVPTPALPSGAGIERDDAWVRDQAPQNFTIPLLSGTDESAVRAFIASHPELRPLAYYRFERRGSEWFAALFGSFESRALAEQAAAALPAEIRANAPWVTRFRRIQAAM